MATKKGLLSSYQLGALAGFGDIFKTAAQGMNESALDTATLFYASIFQAGLNEVVLFGQDRDKEGFPSTKFVESRVSKLPQTHYAKYHMPLDSLFKSMLPDDYEDKKEYDSIPRLKNFISDLLLAMDIRAGLIQCLPTPDLNRLEAVLPEELFVPIRNLLLTFEQESLDLPIPRMSVRTDEVERFQEIIESDLFSEYNAAQIGIDRVQLPRPQAITEIGRTGRNLFKANAGLLGLRKATLWLLEVTPKLVDGFFGKLPGVLSGLGSDLGKRLLEQEHRVVVYKGDLFLFDLLRRNLRKWAGRHAKQN
ncbi:hypothetical protein MYX82_03210 [Acidobacteria bacterium AH-259-D05]|nr:hypothetical protein [Acidobacteria bacterium AH-259-D05]